jgi:hypothetical protein
MQLELFVGDASFPTFDSKPQATKMASLGYGLRVQAPRYEKKKPSEDSEMASEEKEGTATERDVPRKKGQITVKDVISSSLTPVR